MLKPHSDQTRHCGGNTSSPVLFNGGVLLRLRWCELQEVLKKNAEVMWRKVKVRSGFEVRHTVVDNQLIGQSH